MLYDDLETLNTNIAQILLLNTESENKSLRRNKLQGLQ